jgi:hypothetical protein
MVAYAPIYTSVVQVQAKTGLSNTEVDLTNDEVVRATIEEAEKEVESITGRKFTSGVVITEYFSGADKDILGNSATSIQLSQYPIQSITAFKLIDMGGSTIVDLGALTDVQIAAGTFETSQYWLEVQSDNLSETTTPNGKIILKVYTIPKGTNNVKVGYTYGYTTVPPVVKALASNLAGIRCWVRFLGGQYNRLNSYSIPQQSVDKGDIYVRGAKEIELLNLETERLLDRIGRKSRTLAFATGGLR